MCLAIPGKIISVEGTQATIDYDGVSRAADISFVENAQIGAWVLVHAGFAIQNVDEKTARETYRLLDEFDEKKVQ